MSDAGFEDSVTRIHSANKPGNKSNQTSHSKKHARVNYKDYHNVQYRPSNIDVTHTDAHNAAATGNRESYNRVKPQTFGYQNRH